MHLFLNEILFTLKKNERDYFLIHQFLHLFWSVKKNHLIETVLLGTHNIRLGLRDKKLFFNFTAHYYLEACKTLDIHKVQMYM